MSLKEQIVIDMKNAMKKRDLARVKVLRFLNSSIKNKEIELRPASLTDEHIIGVMKKQIKQNQEALEHYTKANYTEQATEEKFQLSILQSYLPQTLSAEETTKMVLQSITETKAQSIKDMGSVMKSVMSKAKGSVAGKLLSHIVREELSKL